MNEDRKKRGIKNHKILMTVAICALFLGSSNTFAARSTSHENHGVMPKASLSLAPTL